MTKPNMSGPHRSLGSLIEPGQRVLHPGRPDWGVGQVQSAVGDRITVNFRARGESAD